MVAFHNSPGYLEALRYELSQAQGGHAGGQAVDEGRIAAIEQEIARVEGVVANAESEEAPETDSNTSTDYKSDEVEPEEEESVEEAAPPLETTDATEELENTNGPTV